MNRTTFEAEIDHGHVTVKEAEMLPDRGRGLLILLPSGDASAAGPSVRVTLPLICGDGTRRINPSTEELDASLWD